MNTELTTCISRRTWIKNSIVGLGFPLAIGSQTLAQFDEIALKIGIVTDAHYAEKGTVGNRHYQDSVLKMDAKVDVFNEHKLNFTVFIGDLIDGHASAESDLKNMAIIEAPFSRFNNGHYVLGNHDLLKLEKGQFIEHCGAKKPYYSFDQ